MEEAGPVQSFVFRLKDKEEVSRQSRLNPDPGRLFVALLERPKAVLVSLFYPVSFALPYLLLVLTKQHGHPNFSFWATRLLLPGLWAPDS